MVEKDIWGWGWGRGVDRVREEKARNGRSGEEQQHHVNLWGWRASAFHPPSPSLGEDPQVKEVLVAASGATSSG